MISVMHNGLLRQPCGNMRPQLEGGPMKRREFITTARRRGGGVAAGGARAASGETAADGDVPSGNPARAPD